MSDADIARILVVDDEESMRRFLSILLEKDGHEVVLASGGAEALTRLESESFDVLVTDLKMPGMTGLELLEKVREVDPSLPVVVLTAFASDAWCGLFDRALTRAWNTPQRHDLTLDAMGGRVGLVVGAGSRQAWRLRRLSENGSCWLLCVDERLSVSARTCREVDWLRLPYRTCESRVFRLGILRNSRLRGGLLLEFFALPTRFVVVTIRRYLPTRQKASRSS